MSRWLQAPRHVAGGRRRGEGAHPPDAVSRVAGPIAGQEYLGHALFRTASFASSGPPASRSALNLPYQGCSVCRRYGLRLGQLFAPCSSIWSTDFTLPAWLATRYPPRGRRYPSRFIRYPERPTGPSPQLSSRVCGRQSPEFRAPGQPSIVFFGPAAHTHLGSLSTSPSQHPGCFLHL